MFELCRFLAHDHREAVLATETERRVSILSEMRQIMLLDEWHHPDLAIGHARPLLRLASGVLHTKGSACAET